MPQTVNVNFRLDETTKKTLEEVCFEMEMTMNTAFTIFAVKVARERRIPFETTAKLFGLFLILKSSGNFSLIVLMSNCGLEVNVLIIKKLVS